jgi:TetR/AcrR family transcriptional repressor of nem operon
VLQRKRMCLCGILAAEYPTLPSPMRGAVTRFFDDNEAWLTTVLERGQADGSLSFDESPAEAANMLLSGLEGAMLVARPYGDVGRFRSVARCLLASLSS